MNPVARYGGNALPLHAHQAPLLQRDRKAGSDRADSEARAELECLAHAWDAAIRTNDPAVIGRYMHDEWMIVGSDGSVGDRDTFLDLVESGSLTHDVMESHDIDIRVYGDAAVVVCRGISGGEYQGRAFHLVERVTSVFVRGGGSWTCVATHLSRLDED